MTFFLLAQENERNTVQKSAQILDAMLVTAAF